MKNKKPRRFKKRTPEEMALDIIAVETICNDPRLTIEEQVQFMCAYILKGGRHAGDRT
jgi:hypothetical protein